VIKIYSQRDIFIALFQACVYIFAEVGELGRSGVHRGRRRQTCCESSMSCFSAVRTQVARSEAAGERASERTNERTRGLIEFAPAAHTQENEEVRRHCRSQVDETLGVRANFKAAPAAAPLFQ